ncbi:MAG TPA: bacillithiol biosynthesis BshC, partial [Thermoanaerobaculia bacterium]|nr:bacillithiol biosynthesis BshC [Thermoanaerobaculia bacterium]
PNLERPLEKTRDHVLGAFDTFAGKVRAAAARRDEIESRRIERLREALLPGGRLQERMVASAHFPGKYGRAFADAVWEQMELDGAVLQVVTP